MLKPELNVTILTAFADKNVERRFCEMLSGLDLAGKIANGLSINAINAIHLSTPDELLKALEEIARGSNVAAVVISDLLVEQIGAYPRVHWEPTSYARELLNSISEQRIALIGISESRFRVLDIDRLLPANCSDSTLAASVAIVLAKLCYLSPPPKRTLEHPVSIRAIRSRGEYLDYFRLRHRVYRVMGYLDPELESRCNFELDWCDGKAIHLGAFENVGVAQKLIGCARVVLSHGDNEPLRRVVEDVADTHAVLRRRVRRPLALMLPLFQSQPGSCEVINQVALQDLPCGELSRVIVDSAFRGTGLSDVLVRSAISASFQSGVRELYLECLKSHCGVYSRHGFSSLPRMQGTVVGVNRTMVVMQLQQQDSVVSSATSRLWLAHAKTCACHHRDCFQGEYLRVRTADCPLRY